MKALVIGGTVSGVGKTTVALGLISALKRRCLRVQPFKAGPDYIDTSHHTAAAGIPSRNLDTWMLPRSAVIELFNRAVCDKDIAVIEGVMGLFDGHSACSDEGSTAELAKMLCAPVLLVLDCASGARSIAAMLSGYKYFDPSLNLIGVILNNIGSEAHLDLCRDAIEYYCKLPVLGYLPPRKEFAIKERHLGLIPAAEQSPGQDFFENLAAQCDANFNIPEILRLSEIPASVAAAPVLFPARPEPKTVKIGVASDKAFTFYYQDNLNLLSAWGAELEFFSPLKDGNLPEGLSGLYIGGGFPEIYAAELSANSTLIQQIKDAVNRSMPVYAECGGLIYLGENIIDLHGKRHRMVGAMGLQSRIDGSQLTLGYRTIKALSDGPILRKGEIVRGHEFHWSVAGCSDSIENAYRFTGGKTGVEGYRVNRMLASYIHLHFGSLPSMAPRFVEYCQQFSSTLTNKLDFSNI